MAHWASNVSFYMADELEKTVDRVEDRLDRVERLLEQGVIFSLDSDKKRAEDEKAWKLRHAELEEAITVLVHTPLTSGSGITPAVMAAQAQYKKVNAEHGFDAQLVYCSYKEHAKPAWDANPLTVEIPRETSRFRRFPPLFLLS